MSRESGGDGEEKESLNSRTGPKLLLNFPKRFDLINSCLALDKNL